MATEELIPVIQFCTIHQVEITFIESLRENGLIQFVTREQVNYIQQEEIGRLEKMLRLHYELDINPAGIETIFHLLQRMENMQEKITAMKNRLRIYEDK
ncbi:MAG TPA: chaperone modulator CbpM [Bacteroidia bacterium]|jgi:hypothetical protein|nr:chaperone modulator CbpM [Bacteroidia bacterium]